MRKILHTVHANISLEFRNGVARVANGAYTTRGAGLGSATTHFAVNYNRAFK